MDTALIIDNIDAQVWHNMDTALIINNVVAQVWRGTPSNNIQLPDAQQGELVEFEIDVVTAGMIWDGENVSVPVKPLADLKVEALKALDEEFEKQVVELTGNKPPAERDMWMMINLTAKEFLGGDETKREFLEAQVPPLKKAELIEAGEDVATWKANDAAKKEAITAQVVQMAMGMKNTAKEAIEAAETHEAFAATIESMKAQEAAIIAAFKAAIAAQQT